MKSLIVLMSALFVGISVIAAPIITGVTAEQRSALYCVIDLSGGPNATNYPFMYLDAVPEGGWSNVYKTEKLVLRRIEAGTYRMGGRNVFWEFCPGVDPGFPRDVTLSHPFYIGIFEVTQKQYELVIGVNPSVYKNDSFPVENVTTSSLRGNDVNWPLTGVRVSANSFFGKLREKTGFSNLDLPTEAQWEYACRAGTTTDFNFGANYTYPIDSSCGFDPYQYGILTNHLNEAFLTGINHEIEVGSYIPNAWELYDMHGNVCELCLDHYFDFFDEYYQKMGTYLSENAKIECVTNFVGSMTSSCGDRALRGGFWNPMIAFDCSSSGRVPSGYFTDYDAATGFRVCMVVAGNEEQGVMNSINCDDGSCLLMVMQNSDVRNLVLSGTWTNYLSRSAWNAATLNAIGANGMPIWKSYVLGVNPNGATNVCEQIQATIKIANDGTPIIDCIPNLSNDAYRGSFLSYVVKGRSSLDSTAKWEAVTDENRADMRFFRIEVDIK